MRGQSHRAPASGPGLLPSRPRARAAAGAEGGSPTSTFPPGRERRRGGQQGAWVCCPDKLSNSPKVTQLVRSKTGGGGEGAPSTQTTPTPSPTTQVGWGAASRLLNRHMIAGPRANESTGQPPANAMKNFSETAQGPPHPHTEATPRFSLGAGARQPRPSFSSPVGASASPPARRVTAATFPGPSQR